VVLLWLALPSALAVRYGQLEEDQLRENCPVYCRSFNFVFMKTSGKSPAEVQKEVNKKCRFTMCEKCAGGGGRDGVPCCTPNCEVMPEERDAEVEETLAMEVAEHDPCEGFEEDVQGGPNFMNSQLELKGKFDPWAHHTDPFSGLPIELPRPAPAPAPTPVFSPAPAPMWHPAPSPMWNPAPSPFRFPTFTPAPAWGPFPAFTPAPVYNIPKFTTPTETKDAVYTPKPNEECQYLPGAFWCPGESYSPGLEYHKRFMEPLCCTEVSVETTTSLTTTVLQYIPKFNEECEYKPGALWCPGSSYSPGYKYAKRFMEPLCCVEVENWGWKPKPIKVNDDEGTSVDGPPKEESSVDKPVVSTTDDDKSVDKPADEGTSNDKPATPGGDQGTKPKPKPDASLDQMMGYKAIKGEVCWHEKKGWCRPPSYNVGEKYRKGSMPLCCQKVFAGGISKDNEDLDHLADTFIKNFTVVPSDLEEETPELQDPDCPADTSFVLKSQKLNCVDTTICVDEVTGKPEDKICCSKGMKQVADALTAYDHAMDACEKVSDEDCSPSSQAAYAGSVPKGYFCKKMFWCVDDKDGADERVGPVATERLCGSIFMSPVHTCAATKVA